MHWLRILLLLLAVPGSSRAASSGGVETFDGTAKDAITWVETVAPDGSVSQNDVLVVDGGGGNQGPRADYATRTGKVGVGNTVSVEVVAVPVGIAALFLSTDSEGTDQTALFDDDSLSLWYNGFFEQFEANYSRDIGGLQGLLFGMGTPPPVPGCPYVLEIERTSSTSAAFRASDCNGTIGSVTHDFPGETIPDQLFISLLSFGHPATYDNVRAPVPDGLTVPALPGWMQLLLALGLVTIGLLLGREIPG